MKTNNNNKKTDSTATKTKTTVKSKVAKKTSTIKKKPNYNGTNHAKKKPSSKDRSFNRWECVYVRTNKQDNKLLAECLIKYYDEHPDIVHFPQNWCEGWISIKDFPLPTADSKSQFILLHGTIANIIRLSIIHGMKNAIMHLKEIVNGD